MNWGIGVEVMAEVTQCDLSEKAIKLLSFFGGGHSHHARRKLKPHHGEAFVERKGNPVPTSPSGELVILEMAHYVPVETT